MLGKLTGMLYSIARVTNTLGKASSGRPGRIGKRLVNKWIGRHIASKLFLK